jgi:hypothetical protein
VQNVGKIGECEINLLQWVRLRLANALCGLKIAVQFYSQRRQKLRQPSEKGIALTVCTTTLGSDCIEAEISLKHRVYAKLARMRGVHVQSMVRMRT